MASSLETMRRSFCPRHLINVDPAERQAALLSLLQECDAFDVKLVRLHVGDYLIDDEILIERKTTADFSTSLIDGRLFRQAYRLAHCRWRPVLIIEGPDGGRVADVHPTRFRARSLR